ELARLSAVVADHGNKSSRCDQHALRAPRPQAADSRANCRCDRLRDRDQAEVCWSAARSSCDSIARSTSELVFDGRIWAAVAPDCLRMRTHQQAEYRSSAAYTQRRLVKQKDFGRWRTHRPNAQGEKTDVGNCRRSVPGHIVAPAAA